ncbi:hypothetical protein BKA61DRAFT_575288 [Leptodontidium sp. MPI-SDFR-AT-0119]|nr:hypothetical protein BKA61DRAFT_575288 [Leptodontidium sp. MPI-SDFR-AT-0119]
MEATSRKRGVDDDAPQVPNKKSKTTNEHLTLAEDENKANKGLAVQGIGRAGAEKDLYSEYSMGSTALTSSQMAFIQTPAEDRRRRPHEQSSLQEYPSIQDIDFLRPDELKIETVSDVTQCVLDLIDPAGTKGDGYFVNHEPSRFLRGMQKKSSFAILHLWLRSVPSRRCPPFCTHWYHFDPVPAGYPPSASNTLAMVAVQFTLSGDTAFRCRSVGDGLDLRYEVELAQRMLHLISKARLHCRAYAHKSSNGFAAHEDRTEAQGVNKDHPTNSISETFLRSRPDIAPLRGG